MFNSWYYVAGFIYDDIYSYLLIILLLAMTYHMLFYKKIYVDIFDPLFVMLLSILFADSILFLMYINNLFINKLYFSQALISEIFFLIGLCLFKDKVITFEYDKYNIEIIKNELYIIYGVLFVFFTCSFYFFYGIPILSGNNHLVATMHAGVVIRPLTAIKMIFLVLWMDRLLHKKIDAIPMGGIFISSCIMNGSRGEIVMIAFAAFFLKCFYYKYTKCKIFNYKKIKYSLIFLIISVILISIYIQFSEGERNFGLIIATFLFRLSVTGDIFGYIYASDIGEILYKNYNYIDFIINPIMNTLHMIPSDETIPGIGYQILQLINNNNLIESGPNARHNVMGWISFGYLGSFVYSFFIGGCISFICRKLFCNSSCHPCIFLIFIGLYNSVVALPTEFMLGFSYSFDVIFVNGIIMYIYCKIRGVSMK